MNSLRSSARRGFLVFAAVAATAATVLAGQINAQTSVYGLWRDPQGGLWCGGSCGEGQQCCTIAPLLPEKPI